MTSCKVHDLKIWVEHFFPLVFQKKTCEVRINDRDYKVGDILHLMCWDKRANEFCKPLWQTHRKITHIDQVPDSPYVCLSLGWDGDCVK